MKNSGPASSTDARQCIIHNLLIISEPNNFPMENGYLHFPGSQTGEQEWLPNILGADVEGILIFFDITYTNAAIHKNLNP